MAGNRLLTSLTRIADFGDYEIMPLARAEWAWGDYVVGEVIAPPSPSAFIELRNGRLTTADVGDQLVGAFATRFATLEATGSWQEIGDDGRMSAMTAAGLFGVITSLSPFGQDHVTLGYLGHVVSNGRKRTMAEFAAGSSRGAFATPVILVIGSSMSAGKTQSARIIIRRLKAMGLNVAAAKLTGAGRYRDILTMGDAGADAIFDFVDAGLPSTVCSTEVFEASMRGLLGVIGEAGADILVVEAGASPLEPYNGDTIMRLLRENIKMTLLCASDPYAVVGMIHAFDCRPDLVAGIAANTDAGQALIEKLTGLPSLRLMDRASLPALDKMLRQRFNLS